MNASLTQETLRTWETEPEKAKVTVVLTARSEGTQAVLESGPFTFRCDTSPVFGGTNQAPGAGHYLLGALAGCAVTFIKDFLGPQLGVQVSEVEARTQYDVDVRGLFGVRGAAPDLRNLQIAVKIISPDSPENVQRVYQAWQERCSILLSLIKPMSVDSRFEVP